MAETADDPIPPWAAPVEKSLASHPEGANYTAICWDTGASVGTIDRVLRWLDRQGRLETFGDPPRWRLKSSSEEQA